MDRILVVDDEASIREVLRAYLEASGYEVLEAGDGSQALDVVRRESPSVVLLDLGLPDRDGLEVMQGIAAASSAYVLVVTARAEEVDRLVGLRLGADDYITKPFDPTEMVARVKAVLRRVSPQGEGQTLGSGGIEMDLTSHRVTAGGQSVELALKEFEVLRLLLSQPGVVFTRERLLSEVWGMDYDGETRTVDVHIRTLRAKLGAAGEQIETVRGVGYRMGDGK